MLSFDYELVHGLPIQNIRGSGRQIANDGSIHYDELLIGVGQDTVFVQVNIDTDELEVGLTTTDVAEAASSRFADVPELVDCVGRELGWCWEARNYRGHWDALCISISGIDPDFFLVGKASSIELSQVSRIVAFK